jgi:aminoglycoside phosphotransferase (APT) family kinase protein
MAAVDSLTRHPLDEGQIATLVGHAFGPGARLDHCVELTGGTFNAVHGVDLVDGRRLVLKVAPPPQVPLLTYEHDLIWAEAHFYRRARAAGLPVPEVCSIGLDRVALPRDYVFVTWLPGTPLTTAGLPPDADAAVRGELGSLAAALHATPGEWFGYPRRDGRTRAGRWSESFTAMVDDVLADAGRWGVPLPAGVTEAVARHRAALDEVRLPSLVHFDLWDGNVFVDDRRVSGLIDGERCFYGDPLAELVSMALLREVDDVPEMLAGYAARAGRPLLLDGSARIRLALYTVYLYLIMIVEGPARGYGGAEREAFVDRLRALLDAQLART